MNGKFGTLLFIAALAGLCCGARACAAFGEEISDRFVERLFQHAPTNGKLSACFKRTYDDTHLAQHRLQSVRSMVLLATSAVEEEQRTYEVRMSVIFKNHPVPFETQGSRGALKADSNDTTSARKVQCGIDCDGGSIDVALQDEDAVLVSVPDGARLWRAGSDGSSEQSTPRFAADDKLFRLGRTELSTALPCSIRRTKRNSDELTLHNGRPPVAGAEAGV
jgi:hypothetical protein